MTMRRHLNVPVSDGLLASIDEAAARRGLNRSAFVRWALSRVLSEDEPYVYEPPTLPGWQVEAWTLLLRSLLGKHLVLIDGVEVLLRQALAMLNERDMQVLTWRFGLEGPRYTLEEVTAVTGTTRERVRQVEAQALRRMRYWLRNSGIWELLGPQLNKEEAQ